MPAGGHFGEPVDHETLDFVKEFGLIRLVVAIAWISADRRVLPSDRSGGKSGSDPNPCFPPERWN
jgi:hypothetical protein